MNAQQPLDSARPLDQTPAAGPLAHPLLRLLDAAATGTLAAVRGMLAHTNHTPLSSPSGLHSSSSDRSASSSVL
jgi:hypothetical protein